MKNFMKLYGKQIKLILSSLCTLIVIILFMTSVYGWYTSNATATASSLQASSDNSNIHLREYIEIKRYFVSNGVAKEQEDNTYKRVDSSNTYYKWDTETLDFEYSDKEKKKKIPMSFDSIFPNEYLDITLWYYPDEMYKDNSYTINLTNFSDSNGKFSETHTIGDTTETETFTHSVLGVYRVGEVTTTTTTNDDGTKTEKRSVNNWNWLCQYNGDYEADTTYSSVTFKSGSFKSESTVTIEGDKQAYYTTTFRIELSLEQLSSKMTYVSTNALSEKSITIGAIRLLG